MAAWHTAELGLAWRCGNGAKGSIPCHYTGIALHQAGEGQVGAMACISVLAVLQEMRRR